MPRPTRSSRLPRCGHSLSAKTVETGPTTTSHAHARAHDASRTARARARKPRPRGSKRGAEDRKFRRLTRQPMRHGARGEAGFRAIVQRLWRPRLRELPRWSATRCGARATAVAASITDSRRRTVRRRHAADGCGAERFATFAASVPRLVPQVEHVVVGNEPNTNFWDAVRRIRRRRGGSRV